MVSTNSPSSVELVIGQLWNIRVTAAELPLLAVLLPDDETLTPAVEFVADGHDADLEQMWLASFVPTLPGRHVAVVTDPDGGTIFLQAHVRPVTLTADMPNGDSLDAWLGQGEHSWTVEECGEAMAVALAAQRRVCRVPAAMPDDLREAAHRRGGRYLYLRRQMSAQPRDDGDYDSPPLLPPGRDFETRALESPFRKLGIG